jgi:hypothetical protein
VTEVSADDWKEGLISYVLAHGDNLDFTRHFWKGCEPIEADIIQYWKFTTTLRLANEGRHRDLIAEDVTASSASIYYWRHLVKLPKLAYYLKAFLARGVPREGYRWLTMECSHGHGIPIGPFLEIPLQVNSWSQIAGTLKQLPNLEDAPSHQSRDYLLGFLLGILMGDAAKTKSKHGASHRHIGLVLSKKYDTNVLIGDFSSLCARSIGLRMHRIEDLARPKNKPNGFYAWVSQASPLIDWIYNVALGLKDGELTTYDPVRADWMLLAPREFRVGLIQGIAESDGSVSVASQTVEFWVDPHRDLLEKLLALEGLKAFRDRQVLAITKSHAIASFSVPIFNPTLRTVRYKRHELMATAQRLDREDRIPEILRKEIMTLSQQGLSVPTIIERLAETRGVLISFEAGQRWAMKAGSEKPDTRDSDNDLGDSK